MDKRVFLENSKKILEEMIGIVDKVDSIDLNSLCSEETVFCIVDMVNGFAKEGILSSPRINNLIEPIKKLMEKCKEKNIKVIAFADSHPKDSIELKFRPKHCVKGTVESEIIEELTSLGIDKVFEKNSTNGFVTEEYMSWIEDEGQKYNNFIVVGDCTDICVSQYVITQKGYFNERNMDKRIIVPINAVDTYDLGVHNAEFLNLISYYQMIDNGIEVVKSID